MTEAFDAEIEEIKTAQENYRRRTKELKASPRPINLPPLTNEQIKLVYIEAREAARLATRYYAALKIFLAYRK